MDEQEITKNVGGEQELIKLRSAVVKEVVLRLVVFTLTSNVVVAWFCTVFVRAGGLSWLVLFQIVLLIIGYFASILWCSSALIRAYSPVISWRGVEWDRLWGGKKHLNWTEVRSVSQSSNKTSLVLRTSSEKLHIDVRALRKDRDLIFRLLATQLPEDTLIPPDLQATLSRYQTQKSLEYAD